MAVGPVTVHIDNKGIIDGLWRGERRCIDCEAEDADLLVKILEKLHSSRSMEMWVEVERVEAHRTKNDIEKMNPFENKLRKETKKQTSWQRKEPCWIDDISRKQEQKPCEEKERMCMQPCSMQPSFTVWLEN